MEGSCAADMCQPARGSARLTVRGRKERVGRTQVALRSSWQSVKQVARQVPGLMNLIRTVRRLTHNKSQKDPKLRKLR
jgi:hypothetical protein